MYNIGGCIAINGWFWSNGFGPLPDNDSTKFWKGIKVKSAQPTEANWIQPAKGDELNIVKPLKKMMIKEKILIS